MYTLGPSSDSPGPAFQGLRQYWQYFQRGAHLPAYDAGRDAGKADLEAASFDFLNELAAVVDTDRDDDWQAKVDGYKDATRSRGPTQFG